MRWTYTGPMWWIFSPGAEKIHIARSNLEGTETECGIILEKGWATQRRGDRPMSCCPRCDASIAAINPIFSRDYA